MTSKYIDFEALTEQNPDVAEDFIQTDYVFLDGEYQFLCVSPTFVLAEATDGLGDDRYIWYNGVVYSELDNWMSLNGLRLDSSILDMLFEQAHE